ncbi:MAG: hypothetical protein JRF55_09455 [Deltaproteobacteria bacterium]|nr:hypothetical protein [Deltaproteobacteria bacterium]
MINRIQRARKSMDLAYEARIEVSWNAEGDLAQAIEEHANRIGAETLAAGFTRGGPDTTSEHDTEVEGNPLSLSITQS